jgi:uncharacterized tellurite resistance protein B-like protein
MLKRLQSLFQNPATPATENAFDDTKIATAALLVCAAMMDTDFGDKERAQIGQILRNSFELTAEEADELVKLGEKEEGDAVDLFGWTRTLKDAYDADERLRLVEGLWEVVYADGVLHEYEANLLRRIAGLIYVPDRDVGLARQRVLTRLGIDG